MGLAGKMDEKLKSKNKQFSEWGWGEGRCRERRYAPTYLFRYTSECTIS